MIAWSRRHTLMAGLALILLANAVALAGVAYNRSGEPDSTLTLTQRELAVPYNWDFTGENSGIALRLQWRTLVGQAGGVVDGRTGYSAVGVTPVWLDRAKLAALGFDVTKPADTPAGRLYYEKLLPKEVFLVLELDGAAYRTALERARKHEQEESGLLAANAGKTEFVQRAKEARKELAREEREYSRLFVIDAGRDAAALRVRYPDRDHYAILRGRIRPQLIESNKVRPYLSGYVVGPSIDEVNVPLAYRKIFEPLKNTRRNPYGVPAPGGVYAVSVAFGRRLEPWITGVSAQPAP